MNSEVVASQSLPPPEAAEIGMRPLRISMVEDDADIRDGLAFLLNKTPGFVCVNSYATAEAALNGIPNDRPDVVLMDINLPGMSGVDCVRALTAAAPDLIVLMLTVYEETEPIFQSLMAGASGYLLKRTSPAELLEAIRQAHSGSSPMSGHIARKVVQYFRQKPPPKTAPAAPNPERDGLGELSPREHEVLECLAQGYLYKEIAERLGISIDTVRKHLGRVYQKLHVHSRTEAVVKYLGR
ncbi:MAG: response regulator transcription factor [Verrucomicrobiota bacterium]|jgi:DNA-binding NarL/FixJ family response regulator